MKQALIDEVLPSKKGTINLNYAINPSVLSSGPTGFRL